MITSRRRLPCGCDRINTCEEDEAISDDDTHRNKEKNALGYVTGSLAPGPLSPLIVARGLTWFFWHDDNRGVELVRNLPHEQLTPLLRGMRDLEPEEWTDQRAVHALFVSLGLSPKPLDGKGG
jgi:hypothetical protein